MNEPSPHQLPSNVADVSVSVVMPILNEEQHLPDAVAMILSQDHPGDLELILALGPSTDRTSDVAADLAATDPRITCVINPSGRTPDALNLAIAASTFPVVVRVDGHAIIPKHYVRTAVTVLLRTGADNVGGIMDARGSTEFEQAVAAAMRSTIGVGNASFHTGGDEGPADTVYLGVFRRSALRRVGGYDPHFARAQDWEMNHRIRATGGTVWFTPDLAVTYRPRSTISALARQYFQYGRWRRVVTRRHGTVTVRYLTPPALVVSIIVSLLATWWIPWMALLPASYLVAVGASGPFVGRGLSWAAKLRVPLVLATMHLSWGVGFLTSPAQLARPIGRVQFTPERVR
ncbi:MAG: glycosyltransferase family 2 protein [Actinomycetota bacterium]